MWCVCNVRVWKEIICITWYISMCYVLCCGARGWIIMIWCYCLRKIRKNYRTGISGSVVTVSGCARYNDFMIRELFTSVSFVPFLVVSRTKFFMVHNCFLRLLIHLRECALSCVGIILSFLMTSVAFLRALFMFYCFAYTRGKISIIFGYF